MGAAASDGRLAEGTLGLRGAGVDIKQIGAGRGGPRRNPHQNKWDAAWKCRKSVDEKYPTDQTTNLVAARSCKKEELVWHVLKFNALSKSFPVYLGSRKRCWLPKQICDVKPGNLQNQNRFFSLYSIETKDSFRVANNFLMY